VPFLLDTNALSDLAREHPTLQAHLQANSSHWVFTSVIVRGELLYGIERLPPSRRRQDLEAKVRRLLSVVGCEPVPVTAADRYAVIKAAAQRTGAAVDENDLWIAATALHLGATLVTRDADFGRIDGLSVTDWTV
jgi:tRNA(fMet)-specific endonuclease VapC